MDQAVRTLWPLKDGTASTYERALRQRNRLLKDWDGHGDGPAGLSGWDEEIVLHGSALTAARAEAIARIQGPASEEFDILSGEPLVVDYQPSVETVPEEDLHQAYRRRLAERRADELIRRTTLVGPHRDELRLVVQGLTARGFASHGEACGAALCLRLALARAVEAETGEAPVVFLDDPFSGLDPERRDRVARGLDGRGQVIMAVPDDAQVPDDAAVWRVKEGGVVVERAP
jgi:DNA replication and repair protein RecF